MEPSELSCIQGEAVCPRRLVRPEILGGRPTSSEDAVFLSKVRLSSGGAPFWASVRRSETRRATPVCLDRNERSAQGFAGLGVRDLQRGDLRDSQAAGAALGFEVKGFRVVGV